MNKIKNHIENYVNALNDARAALDTKKGCKITISKGNSKMGYIASVSTLPLITCPGVCRDTCACSCYADKIATAYNSVKKSYARNTAIALYRPDLYFDQIKTACQMVTFFRWHVSGDIINKSYFENMVKIAKATPHCKHLAFTKRYSVVNDYLKNGGKIPKNLKIIFSAWGSFTPENPYNLPMSNFYDNSNPFQKGWKKCGGNCEKCALNCVGCWTLKNGQVIAFEKH